MDNSRKLWTILIFMIWHQIYVEKAYNVDYFSQQQKVGQLARG